MPDPYASIAQADEELQARLAAVLELRAADPPQRAVLIRRVLRAHFLRQRDRSQAELMRTAALGSAVEALSLVARRHNEDHDMLEQSLQAQIDAANAYEALFVSALFGQWAPRVAHAAQIRPGQRVLDVACGTGVLAREVASITGPTGHVAGVDPIPGMLAVAEGLAPSLEWREGVAESLPFSDQSFDAVLSQFGLMFFTDRHRALGEMLRVLTPGGRLAVAVWDSLDNIPAYAAEVALLERVVGRRAADALRAPFVLGDRHDLAALFEDAGADSVDVTTHRGSARFPTIRVMVEADLRGWLPVVGVTLTEEEISRTLQEAEHALGAYATADDRVAFHLSAHIVTAKKRHGATPAV